MQSHDRRIYYAELGSPLGRILVAGHEGGLTCISFLEGAHPRPPRSEWISRAPDQGLEQALPATLRQAADQLRAYLVGSLREFDLPLAPEGTPFQQAVWRALAEIPYGKTATYGELARRIGRPSAARAVGAANGANPIPVVVPCHRVIGADGKLTGYGEGLPIKAALLRLEQGQGLLA